MTLKSEPEEEEAPHEYVFVPSRRLAFFAALAFVALCALAWRLGFVK